jgi:hypothetical protein
MENNGPYPPAGDPGQPGSNPQPGWAPEWASPGTPPGGGPPPGQGAPYPGGPYPGPGMSPPGPATPPPFAQPGYPQPGYPQPGYPQPPNPGWPQGPQQPGFGGPGMQPPPKRSHTGLIIGGLVGGGVLVVALVVVVLLVAGAFSPDPKAEAVKKLGTAATKLSSARGLKFHGTVASASDTLDGDFKVTAAGRTSASATWGGNKVDLLALDDKLFVKGNTSFWSTQASYTPKWDYIDGNRWGRLASYNFTFDFKQNLSPASLAQKLRQVSKLSITSQTKTSVGGTAATKVVTYSATYYVSNDGRLLRVEGNSYPRYAVDVTQLNSGDATSDLRTGVTALRDSFDSSRTASIDKVRFGTCNTSSCTIFTKVWSTGVSTSPVPVNVFTTISSQKAKAGTHYGDCSTTGTVTSYTAIEVSCTVSGGDWPKAHGGGGSWAHSDAYTAGASSTEIQTMLDGISRE